jgi:hypothetical protein
MATLHEKLHNSATHAKGIDPACPICIKRVADTFVNVLKSWLTPEQFATMQRRNKEETDSRICHSHDFCDANMAMLDALNEHGIDVDADNEDHTALWNKVWEAAKPQLR